MKRNETVFLNVSAYGCLPLVCALGQASRNYQEHHRTYSTYPGTSLFRFGVVNLTCNFRHVNWIVMNVVSGTHCGHYRSELTD